MRRPPNAGVSAIMSLNPFSLAGATIDAQPPIIRAAFWTLLAAFFVVAYTSMAKYLAQSLPIPVIVFVRCVFGLLLFLPWFLRASPEQLKTDRPILMLSRGLATMTALYCIFSAVSLMPIANVVAVQYAKPFVVTIVAIIFLREIMTGHRWLAMLTGFGGMLLIVRPGTDAWNLGILFAIGAMFAEAFGAITLKFLTRTNPPDRIVAYMVLGMLFTSAIPGLIYWQTPSLLQFGWLFLAAVSANLFQQCMARGYAAADATAVMPFEFSRLVFAALFGALFFAESAGIWVWTGGSVIFLAALWMTRAERRAPKA